MPKENVNFRLDETEYDEVKQEAEQRGLSVSEYLRRIVKNRDAARETTHDELVDRVKDIEQQLDDVQDN